jgi:hypothetical protein
MPWISMKRRAKHFFSKAIGPMLAITVGGLGLFGVIKLIIAISDNDERAIQNAYIRVQYDANGHAVNCWVTHRDEVAVSGSSASIYMRTWHHYDIFAKKLGADPAKCDVWDWEGKK